jgi:hypothetical protein
METWKSPRKIEEEAKAYVMERFESYMQMVDRGELTRAIAIAALTEEVGYLNERQTVEVE